MHRCPGPVFSLRGYPYLLVVVLNVFQDNKPSPVIPKQVRDNEVFLHSAALQTPERLRRPRGNKMRHKGCLVKSQSGYDVYAFHDAVYER